MTKRKTAERPLDLWRKFAAVPMPPFAVRSRRDARGRMAWALESGGAVISEWREEDAPGLGAWIGETLARYHGAWHLARENLKLTQGQRKAGAEQAKKRAAEAKKRATRIRTAALGILRDEPHIKTTSLAATLADRGHGGAAALEKKLPEILGRKKSTERR